MKKNIKLKLWSFFWVFIIIFFFLAFSYFIQTNLDFFEGLIVDKRIGMAVYLFLWVLSTVIPPVTTLPVIVLAVGLWGIWIAIFLSVLGWTIGGMIAFWLARRFGVPIIKNFVPLDEIYEAEDRVKVGNNFWSVLFLRMIIPVDVLSYALGLFSKIGFWKYLLATFIGVIPFAFFFAYFGGFPYIYQIILGLLFLVGILGYIIFREIRNLR